MNQYTEFDHQGWEHIWTSNNIVPKYASSAEPNASVIAFAETLPENAFVLDVGCGAGRHLIYLGSRGFRLAGHDISPGGIELSRKALSERGLTFDGRVSDMTSLPWDDNTFDAVISTSTIHHHRRANITKAVAEIKRVLKPGGVFHADFLCTNTGVYDRNRRLADEGLIEEVEPNTFVDNRPDSPDDDGFLPHHFFDEADLRDLLSIFEIIDLHADLNQVTIREGQTINIGKWLATLRKAQTDS